MLPIKSFYYLTRSLLHTEGWFLDSWRALLRETGKAYPFEALGITPLFFISMNLCWPMFCCDIYFQLYISLSLFVYFFCLFHLIAISSLSCFSLVSLVDWMVVAKHQVSSILANIYLWQGLFNLRELMCSHLFFVKTVLLNFFVFGFVFCFVCLCSVSCVFNVASVSGLSILDFPFGFL